MKEIATSVFDFESLILKEQLYVDKTRYVWKIVSGGEKSFFLSRPRRFGKSLLLSTFKAFFQGKKHLFKGLDIECLAPEVWETYPVIHLDLASGSSYEGVGAIESAMKMQLIKSCRDLDVEIADSDVPTMFDNLIDSVYRKYKKNVVVLIDEYDKPILDSMFKPHSSEVVELMADFYQRLKSANDKERFVFITGVTKFAHVSLFSGANNPTDLTRNEDYATLLGYTEEELRHNFAEHIDYLAKKWR